MTLDVLVPTHNRSALLRRTLSSLLAADSPQAMQVVVTVIDNRSTDDTAQVVASCEEAFGGRLRRLYEPAQGRSHALNTGIRETSGDLVATIDDDEEVERGWLRCIERVFADPAVDFVGGPYVPRWGADRPLWLGTAYGAVVGWVDAGPDIRAYGPGFDAMLMGGNAVIRRSVLTRVGPYSPDLGRTARGLMSCEDEDMFKRLLAAGARGFYRPDLIIFHYVPPERLTKRYFRRWCFWRGVSLGILDRRQPLPVSYVFGVPRFMVGVAVRGTIANLRALRSTRDPVSTFKNELAWWDLVGFVCGKFKSRRTPATPGSAAAPAAGHEPEGIGEAI